MNTEGVNNNGLRRLFENRRNTFYAGVGAFCVGVAGWLSLPGAEKEDKVSAVITEQTTTSTTDLIETTTTEAPTTTVIETTTTSTTLAPTTTEAPQPVGYEVKPGEQLLGTFECYGTWYVVYTPDDGPFGGVTEALVIDEGVEYRYDLAEHGQGTYHPSQDVDSYIENAEYVMCPGD